MSRDEKHPADLYDPTVRTTVDEARGTIDNPGRLVGTLGDEETVFELDRPLILIGSDPAADIIVENRKAADYIAEITYESGFYVVRRLDERTAVTVGDKPIEEHILDEGDEIQLADRVFVYRAPAESIEPEQ
jgi:pSer/pThr/pTyr-binding forkhead associated (FHA) protein